MLAHATHLTPSRRDFLTNYPHFQQWKAIDPTLIGAGHGPLNIYLHSPFCAQRCAYCYYRVLTGARREEMEGYVDALCREIALGAERFGLNDRPLHSVYFGGGTPTLLAREQLLKITETLHRHLRFSDAPEFTVEGEPVTLTEKKAEVLKEMGVNRISMGVQSLADEIIKQSKRQDTEAKVLRAIEITRGTGAQVNIDLMSGLAGESDETWQYTVEQALATGVESITIYKTDLHANSQYYKDLREEAIHLPSDEEELQFMQYALDRFSSADYHPWSFFTFTKHGEYRHVHATSNWQGNDCHAFGTSAFGHCGGWLYQNSNDVNRYQEMVENGELPINRGHRLSSLDHVIRSVVLGMKLVEFDLAAFRQRHGFRLAALCGETMAAMREEGYIEYDQDVIRLTAKGMLHGDYSGKRLGQALATLY